jgi:hypothetical protein
LLRQRIRAGYLKHKFQISNKFQYSISKFETEKELQAGRFFFFFLWSLKVEIWNLFVIWSLEFGISD